MVPDGAIEPALSERPELSIVVPALNEVDNVGPLAEQVAAAMGDVPFELIVIDDGSIDGTTDRLTDLAATRPWLRVLRRAKPQGQSAAMAAGIAAARGTFIATLDADLQNDPADLPQMLALLKDRGVDFVQGDRSKNRQDTFFRRRASWVGRTARRLVIGDSVRDTGCSARVMRSDLAKRLPLQYKGMHRFFPAYSRLLGAEIAEYDVRHHPRQAGQTKYGVGVLTRGVGGFCDLLVVRWMANRLRDVRVDELALTASEERS